jgi:hypothetical protein
MLLFWSKKYVLLMSVGECGERVWGFVVGGLSFFFGLLAALFIFASHWPPAPNLGRIADQKFEFPFPLV